MIATVSTPDIYAAQLEAQLARDPRDLTEADLRTIDFATKQLRSEVEAGCTDIRDHVVRLLQQSLTFVRRLSPGLSIETVAGSIEKRLSIVARVNSPVN